MKHHLGGGKGAGDLLVDLLHSSGSNGVASSGYIEHRVYCFRLSWTRFLLSVGFMAFTANECLFLNYKKNPSQRNSQMSFQDPSFLNTSREHKLSTSLFSSFVWLQANDMQGEHRHLESPTAVPIFFIYFAFDYATSRILFLSFF